MSRLCRFLRVQIERHPEDAMRIALLAALIVLPRALRAQPTVPIDSVPRGATVRMWSREPRLAGWRLRYERHTDSSVIVSERPGSMKIRNFHPEILNSGIDRVEVSRGWKFDGATFARRMLKGAGLGLVIGATLGAVGGYADHSGEGFGPIGGGVFIGGIGLVAGTVVGGVSGLLGAERWTEVSLRR